MAHQVSLSVPRRSVGSTSGALVTVEWSVRARLRVDRGAELELARPIRVLSRAADRAACENSPATSHRRRIAVLTISDLSSRRLVSGTALTGRLDIEAHIDFTARSVRVELVMREVVHHGPWIGDDPARNPSDQGRQTDTVVAAVDLRTQQGFHAGRSASIPFRLEVPTPLPGPSVVTTEFTVSWLIRAGVDRGLRPDPFVEVELRGVTMG